MFGYTECLELVEHLEAPHSQMDYEEFAKQVQTFTQNTFLTDSSFVSQ